MKKTLAALIIGAFAASAANAAVVYNNEGTKVDFNGSLRLIMEKQNAEGAGHTHSGLRNAGSRIQLKATHDLGDGYYALGQFRLDFNGHSATQDNFGDIYVKRAYAGFGKKELGEIKFGRQTTIADELGIANDYEYGLISKGKYIPTNGNSVIRYDYKGVKNLQVSLGYQFADTRTADNEVTVGAVQNGLQVGAIYNGKWDDANGVIAKFGYGRTHYKSATSQKHHKDGILASLGYEHQDLLLSVEGGFAKEKKTGNSLNRYFVSPGFQIGVTAKNNVYGNYLFEQVEKAKTSTSTTKDKKHGVLVGVDHELHKQVVVFLEGKYQVTKTYVNGQYKKDSKVKDKAIGAGLRVYW